VKKKLNKVKSSHSGDYLANISNKGLTSMALYLSSDTGLQNFWEKVKASQFACQKYHDFLNAVRKYGSKNM